MEMAKRKWMLLMILIGGLVAAVVVQSVAIYGLQKRLENPKGQTPARRSVVGQNNAGNTNSPVLGDVDSPFGDKDPFGWDMEDWYPVKEMRSMQDRMNHMFGNAFGRFQRSDDFSNLFGHAAFSPDINVEDKGDYYLVTVDLPGMEDSKVDVHIEGRKLTVSGSTQSEMKGGGKGRILHQERRCGRFQRTVMLPSPVNAEKMTTENKEGVLYITLPKEKA